MNIEYTMNLEKLTEDKLEPLFLSVNWESGKYPNELVKAMKGSHSVISAWHEDRLIGLVNALSDGALTVYFHYVLIHPDYQGKGIGRELMRQMLERYKEFQTKLLVAYPDVVDFYKELGFKQEDGNTPMYISDLI